MISVPLPAFLRIIACITARIPAISTATGGTLIIWDKLFGTFEPENPADPVRFGLTKNIATYNPVRIAFHEWVDLFRDAWRATGWTNKLRYVFGNPGWRHGPGPHPTFGARQPT